jgi:hypothetical protein
MSHPRGGEIRAERRARQDRPLRRFQYSGRGTDGIAPTGTGSHEVGGSSECYLRSERGSMGSPREMAGRAFAPVTFSPTAVPRRFKASGSSSLEPASSSERGDALPAFDHLKPSGDSPRCRKRLPWGSVGPSSRHQPAGATYRRKRPLFLLRSVLGVPPALDGLTPRPVLRVCFTPQPRTGFPPLRGLFLSAEPHRVSPAVALVPLQPPPLRLPAPRRRPPTSGPCSPR